MASWVFRIMFKVIGAHQEFPRSIENHRKRVPKSPPRGHNMRPRQPQNDVKTIVGSKTMSFQNALHAITTNSVFRVGGSSCELKIDQKRIEEELKKHSEEV